MKNLELKLDSYAVEKTTASKPNPYCIGYAIKCTIITVYIGWVLPSQNRGRVL